MLADNVPVVAVAMAPVAPLELISPLPEVKEMLPAVNVLVPEIVPDPFADMEIVPVEFELVETALLSAIPPLPAFVCKVILPPAVDVPNVIPPPTVNVLPAVIFTVGPAVDDIIPLLTVDAAVIVKLLPPKVIVLPLLLNVPPVRSVRLAGAVKLAPVVKAAVSVAEPIYRLVAVMLLNEEVGTLKLLDPPMLTVSFVFGIKYSVGAFTVPVIDAL